MDKTHLPSDNTSWIPRLTVSYSSLTTKTKILLGFAAPLSLFSLIAVIAYFSLTHLLATNAWVKHTHDVIAKATALEKLMVDMETGERGFLITGKDSFLAPFIESQKVWDTEIALLEKTVTDNIPQVERLKEINHLQKQWLEEAASVEITQRRKVKKRNINLSYIQEVLKNGHGKKILDDTRGELDKLQVIFENANIPAGTNSVIAIGKALIDQETGQRGFLITGEDAFLAPYHLGLKNLPKQLSNLRQLIDNRFAINVLQKQINNLQSTMSVWVTTAVEPAIELRKQVNLGNKSLQDIENYLTQSKDLFIRDKINLQMSQLEITLNKAQQPLIKNTLTLIALNMVDREAGLHGYLLSGSDEFLQPYTDAKKQIPQLFHQIKLQINQSPNKKELLLSVEKIEALANRWKTEAALPEIAARIEINHSRLSTFDFMQQSISKNAGKDKLDQIRDILTTLILFFKTNKDLRGENFILRLSKAIVDQETGERDFLITGDASYLTSYTQGKKDFDSELLALNIHVASNYLNLIGMQQNLFKLKEKIDTWNNDVAIPEINTRRAINKNAEVTIEHIQNVIIKGTGKKVLDEIRVLIDDLTHDVQSSNTAASNYLSKIEKAIVDRETAERGFLITGEDAFLLPYNDGSNVLKDSFPKLKNIINDSYDRQTVIQQLNEIELLTQVWRRDAMQPEVLLRKKANNNQASYKDITTLVATGLSKTKLDKIRYLLSQLSLTFKQAKNDDANYLVLMIEKGLITQEIAQKGYLVTGRETFLSTYQQEAVPIAKHLFSLKILVNATFNKQQVLAKIEQLSEKTEQWEHVAAIPEMALRRSFNNDSAQMSDVITLIEKETGKKIIDKIRIILKSFISAENSLMIIREKQAKSAANLTILVLVLGSLLAIIIALYIAVLVSNNIVRKLNILVVATEKVTKGQLGITIPEETADEFGQLAKSFNKMTVSIKQSIAKMEQATQAKGDFLANMSHEIRTPMNGVLGTLLMLEDTKLSDEQTDLIHTIRSCSDGLLVIINDILDLSKLEAGKLSLEKRPFNLKSCIDDCSYLLDSLASQKGLNLVTDIESGIPASYLGDAIRIRQVLLNLGSNAIKFTQYGKVTLSVTLDKKENDCCYLRFSINDNGIGISKEDQSKLFKSFSQVDNSTSRKYGGTGLGLVICQQLVGLMNGSIHVTSEVAKGSTFYFTLPLPSIESSQQTAELGRHKKTTAFDANMAKRKPLSILLVEDNTVNQVIAMNLFKKMGYLPDLAKNGLEAIKAVDNKTYDVIFMDMQMPIMDGVEATEKLVEKWGVNKPRIIAMTANVLSQDKQRCFDAGMDDFVAKPIDVEQVVSALEKCPSTVESTPVITSAIRPAIRPAIR